jgi:MFS family permease
MVYVFFIIVVTEFLAVSLDLGAVTLDPDVFFGVLLAIEMVIALVSMPVAAKLAERVGLKPVVGFGFFVYAIFPILLISVPEGVPFTAGLVILMFAFSGLRFAGLPAHKALIVGPAEQKAGGRVSGSYYLVRNTIVIPSAAIGGAIYGGFSVPGTGLSYAGSPTLVFTIATVIGLVGVGYFVLYGKEFEAYQ